MIFNVLARNILPDGKLSGDTVLAVLTSVWFKGYSSMSTL